MRLNAVLQDFGGIKQAVQGRRVKGEVHGLMVDPTGLCQGVVEVKIGEQYHMSQKQLFNVWILLTRK